MFDSQFFIFRLKHLKGIGNQGLLRILAYYLEHPNDVFFCQRFSQIGQVKPQHLERFQLSYQKVFTELSYDFYQEFLRKYKMITILSHDYPLELTTIFNPPIALFYCGDISLVKKTKLAMIGTRKGTEFGKKMVDQLMPSLVGNEVVIVSGLAKGNDTAAHQACIRHGGRTIGVIGCGLDRYYPKENESLQQFMMKKQLVLTEYLPGTPPNAYHFPSRNRIIAGLSRGICVIEAKEKSGTWITAKIGLEEGRDIFAIPGTPLAENSEGCLKLIQEGAKCVITAQDILEEWQDIK